MSVKDKYLIAACILVAAAIFLADILLPLGIAAGVPYVALILIAMWGDNRAVIIYQAALGTFLTILGFALSPSGEDMPAVLANRFLALFAIWSTAIVAHRFKRYDEKLARTNERMKEEIQKQTSELRSAYYGLREEAEVRRHAENALRKSEANYRRLVEMAQEGIWAIDKDAITTYVNSRMAEMLGYSPDEMAGKHLFSFMDETGVALAKEKLDRRAQGIKEQHDFEFIRKDGSRIYAAIETAPILDEEGNYDGAIAGIMDVTTRREYEKTLVEKRQRLATVMDTIADGLYIVNQDGRLEYVNPTAEKYFGISSTELYKRTFDDSRWKVFTPSGLPIPRSHLPFSIIQRTRAPISEYEMHVRQPDGTERVMHINAAPLYGAGKEFLGMVAVQHDITKRKRMEDSLRESGEKYRALMENAAEAIILANEEGRIVEANRKAEELFGYSDSGLVNSHFSKLYPPEEFQENKEAIERLLSEKQESIEIESAIQRKDGSVVPVEISGIAIKFAGKKVVQGIFKDISERKEAEQALLEANKANEMLIDSISSILIQVDEDDKVVKWNHVAEEIFEIPAAWVEGKQFVDAGIDWDWESFLVHLNEARETGGQTSIDDLSFSRGKNGKQGYLGITINPILDPSLKFRGFLLLAADITERKFMAAQLVQAQKLEAVGQLAAGIAHEINTPIQFVGDNMRFIKDATSELFVLIENYERLASAARKFGELAGQLDEINGYAGQIDAGYLKADIPKAIEQSLDGVGRVAEIVRAMKDFSHPGDRKKSPADINNAIKSAISVSKNEWKYHSEVVADLDPDLPLVPCYLAEFNQVILNLIVNAAHAIADAYKNKSGGKGLITIRTRRHGGNAMISVSDTGGGIPEDIRGKIFDPFFTTKDVGKGTGQGLAIAHSVIVEKHGGTIVFASEPGPGTTFTISLPLPED